MFRIRRVYDDITTANKEAITQVQDILRTQIPGLSKNDIAKLLTRVPGINAHRFLPDYGQALTYRRDCMCWLIKSIVFIIAQ